eukprot:21133-Pyramimonas_sp.AAC.1
MQAVPCRAVFVIASCARPAQPPVALRMAPVLIAACLAAAAAMAATSAVEQAWPVSSLSLNCPPRSLPPHRLH